MSDTLKTQETGTDSVIAGEARVKPNRAAASDVPAAPPFRVNPDDLHDLFQETSDNSGEEDSFSQMRSDPNYAALIKDLEEIAKVARELFSNSDESSSPSDDLWKKIELQLPSKPDAV